MLSWRIIWLLLLKAGLVLTAAAFLIVRPLKGGIEIEPARRAALIDLVRQDCGSCHGMTLKGGLGKSLAPERLRGIDKVGIAEVILNGIPGTPMPPWRGLISEAEAAWIAEMLQEGVEK